jgi:hypothetical protein
MSAAIESPQSRIRLTNFPTSAIERDESLAVLEVQPNANNVSLAESSRWAKVRRPGGFPSTFDVEISIITAVRPRPAVPSNSSELASPAVCKANRYASSDCHVSIKSLRVGLNVKYPDFDSSTTVTSK